MSRNCEVTRQRWCSADQNNTRKWERSLARAPQKLQGSCSALGIAAQRWSQRCLDGKRIEPGGGGESSAEGLCLRSWRMQKAFGIKEEAKDAKDAGSVPGSSSTGARVDVELQKAAKPAWTRSRKAKSAPRCSLGLPPPHKQLLPRHERVWLQSEAHQCLLRMRRAGSELIHHQLIHHQPCSLPVLIPGILAGPVGNLHFFIWLPLLLTQTLVGTGCTLWVPSGLPRAQPTLQGAPCRTCSCPHISDILLSTRGISALAAQFHFLGWNPWLTHKSCLIDGGAAHLL